MMTSFKKIKETMTPDRGQEANNVLRSILLLRQFSAKADAAPKYRKPSIELLRDSDSAPEVELVDVTILEDRLHEFGLEGEVVKVTKGPVVSRYEIKLAKGVKLSQVRSISEDLAVALTVERVRILAPIPGTSLIGIEIINRKPATVCLRKVMGKIDKEILPMAVGVNTSGVPKVVDLTAMPHLLVAGHTGSGKSVYLNSVILSILYSKTPDECKLVLVDPKRVEMTAYRNIPHLLRPVINDPEEALAAFSELVEIMDGRYRVLEENGAKNIASYNAGGGKMPYIVVVVDEMADLMMQADQTRKRGEPNLLERNIIRIAQLARAVGIHLVLATQKPSTDVITGMIKSNIPSRISFQVASKSDSRVILDCNGAEKLAGRGDMLLLGPGMEEPERFHGAWVSDEDITAVAKSIGG